MNKYCEGKMKRTFIKRVKKILKSNTKAAVRAFISVRVYLLHNGSVS